jgi:hypothetical protein
VINVSTGLTLGSVTLLGGLTPQDVIFNYTGTAGATVGVASPATPTQGIVLSLNAPVSNSANNLVLNGEIITGSAYSSSNGSDVQAVTTMPIIPESSTVAYFTLGPLSLFAVMLLTGRFSRRKQTVGGRSHDPPESVLDVVKIGLRREDRIQNLATPNSEPPTANRWA